jgi:lipopolysaccharide biosynthesis glycosyltransferase
MINLVYCGNKAMFHGILMSLLSAAQLTKEPLHVFLGTGDFRALNPVYLPLDEKERAFLEKMIQGYNPESQVELLDLTAVLEKRLGTSTNKKTRYTPYCLLRLFLDQEAKIPSKALYLDCDTVVMKDLSLLYSIELGNAYFGWVRDAYGRFLISPNYCNTGVLLMNMDAIRSERVFERALDLLCHHHYFFPDQTALNKVAKGRKLYLAREMNEQKHLRQETVIRHYCNQPRIFPYVHAMIAKPWDLEAIHRVYKITTHDHLYHQAEALWEEEEHE